MTQEELLALLSEQGLFEGNDFMMNNAPPDLTTVMYDNNEGSSSFNSQNFSNYSNSNNNSGYNF
jgi:hypothetical protein